MAFLQYKKDRIHIINSHDLEIISIKKIAADISRYFYLNTIKNYFLIALIVCLEPSFISKVTKYIPCFKSPK